MSIQQGNRGIVKSGLQLYYNKESEKSFRGEATVNLFNLPITTLQNNGNHFLSYTTYVSSGSIPGLIIPGNQPIKTVTEYYTLVATGSYQAEVNRLIMYPINWAANPARLLRMSFYARSISGNTTMSYGFYGSAAPNRAYLSDKWQRYESTGTAHALGLLIEFGNTNSGTMVAQIAGLQAESKSYATPFTTGSRMSNNLTGSGGLLDLSGNGVNSNLDSGYVSFTGSGFFFNNIGGTNVAISPSTPALQNATDGDHTYDCWFKLLGDPPDTYDGYFLGRQGFHTGFVHMKGTPTNLGSVIWYNDFTATLNGWYSLPLNVWYHGASVVDYINSTFKLYINGNLMGTINLTPNKRLLNTTANYHLGGASANYTANVVIGNCKIYNKALSQSEVLQNFNAHRTYYGI